MSTWELLFLTKIKAPILGIDGLWVNSQKFKRMNTLFIILLILFVTPYLVRLAAPYIMKYFFKRMQKNMEKNMGGNYSNNTTDNDFNTGSSNTQSKTNKAKDELGDYVDFEEISEEKKQ